MADVTHSILTDTIRDDIRQIAEELEPVLRPLSGQTLAVTGGAGFLCSYLLDTVAYLNDNAWSHPCYLICYDNFRSGVPNRIRHLEGRKDFSLVNRDLSLGFEVNPDVRWFVHGASIASPVFYRRHPIETIDVNVWGTRNLLNVAQQNRATSVLYLSTSEIYGDPDPSSLPTPETYRGIVSSIGPRACYDESKRLAETLCIAYHQAFQVPVKFVRPFNVYGPGQRLDDGRIMPDLISASIDRRPLVLYSDGRPTRAFCYVSDAVRAMWLVLMSNAQGEVFNIGNDEGEVSIRDLAESVRRAAGPPWLDVTFQVSMDPNYTTDNPNRRCPDLTKLRQRLGWVPHVNLEAGLNRTLASYRAVMQTAPTQSLGSTE